ncbi:MAG: hypothetical protein ABJB85_01450 [Nitrososphaerota archaeon]
MGATCPNRYQAIFMGPRNVRESRRLIPVFNEIGIRNNKGGSKKQNVSWPIPVIIRL